MVCDIFLNVLKAQVSMINFLKLGEEHFGIERSPVGMIALQEDLGEKKKNI